MFRSKTLFVVGAGASCEAGLPSGEGLKSKIAEALDIRFERGMQGSGDYLITEAFRQVVSSDGRGRDLNPYLHKAWRIRDVMPAALSIDNFLDAHRGDKILELCGKLAIVRSILNAERQSKLRSSEEGSNKFLMTSLAGSWYLSFLQMLSENLSKQQVRAVFDNVTIITFNYDRCLERFLPQALAEYYDLSDAEAYDIVRSLRIIHPYGQVGSLPWQAGTEPVPFGDDTPDLLALSGQIKTFTEGLKDEAVLGQIRQAVIEAKTFVFLGFAFHPMNMELLKAGASKLPKRVFATAHGLSDSDRDIISVGIKDLLYGNAIPLLEGRGYEPELPHLQCGEFFRQYFRSLSSAA